MNTDVVRVDEVRRRLDCSTAKAYEIMQRLNAELKAKGFITVAGRVSRAYFEEKCKLKKSD